MSELRVLTTDEGFVEDLNAAGIDGVRAEYRPTMAYDSAEHILEIVITGLTLKAFELFGQWIVQRFRKAPPSQFTIVNSGENAINIINYIDNEVKRAQRQKPTATRAVKRKKASSSSD